MIDYCMELLSSKKAGKSTLDGQEKILYSKFSCIIYNNGCTKVMVKTFDHRTLFPSNGPKLISNKKGMS